MNGILGEVGKALIRLQETGAVTVEATDELEAGEIVYYVKETLKGVKATYKAEEDGEKIHVLLI